MGITEQLGEGFALLRIRGILDGHTEESEDLSRYFDMVSDEIRSHFVLDFSGVDYINSSMLGACIHFLSSAQASGHRVIILKPAVNVANVLDLTGLSQLLPVIQDEREIAAELKKSPLADLVDEVVDYDELAEEIEAAIQGEPRKPQGDSQLDRLLGDHRE